MNTKILSDMGMQTTDVEAGTVLIREDSDNRNVYILVSGKVEVTMRGQTIATLDAPGTALGQVAVLLGEKPVATTTAVESSTVYVIDDFRAFLLEHPEACLSTAQALAGQMVSSVNHMVWMKEQLAELQKGMEVYVPAFPQPGADRDAPPVQAT